MAIKVVVRGVRTPIRARGTRAGGHQSSQHLHHLRRRAQLPGHGACRRPDAPATVEGEVRSRLPTPCATAGQIAEALAAAHAHGIVHRDLKPGNIMVAGGNIKVLDFGIATHWHTADPQAETVSMGTTPQGITRQGETVGTPPYMSPEQAEGKLVDARSDVFAFGIVLYEMVCGQRPFRGDTASRRTLAATLQATPEPPRQRRHEIPRPLEQLILRCLEKSPDARFGSARRCATRSAVSSSAASSSKVAVPRIALIAAVLVLARGRSRVDVAVVSERGARAMGREHGRPRDRALAPGRSHARGAAAVPRGGAGVAELARAVQAGRGGRAPRSPVRIGSAGRGDLRHRLRSRRRR